MKAESRQIPEKLAAWLKFACWLMLITSCAATHIWLLNHVFFWNVVIFRSRKMAIILISRFFKENVRYPVWTCRDQISLILETQIGSLKLVLFFRSFSGHRPKFFWNDRKNLSQFGDNVWKGWLVNTVVVSFNTIVKQMTKISHRKKKPSPKTP